MTLLILAPSIEKRVHSFHYFLNLVGRATLPQGVVSEGSEERKYMLYEAEERKTLSQQKFQTD